MFKFRHFIITRHSALLLALAFVISTGCWNQVEYGPREKRSAEQPAVANSPKRETPAPTEESSSTGEETPVANATEELSPAEHAETPAETIAPFTTSHSPVETVAPLKEEKLTYDDLFGEPDSPPAETPTAEVPPLADAEAMPPVEPSPPASEPSTDTLLPHERPSTPPASTSADRYVTTPTTDPPAAAPTPMPPAVPDRYATTPEPLTPTESADDQPFFLRDTPSPPAAESPTPDRYAESSPAEPVPMTPIEPSAPPAADTPSEVAPSLPSSTRVDAPAEATHAPADIRLGVWKLGSKWTLWLMSQHAGAPEEEQAKYLQDAQALAQELGVELPQTSPYSASKPTAAFLESVLPAARELGIAIGQKHGTEDMAIFEVAAKSNLLLVLSESRPDLIPAVVRAVADAAERAKIDNRPLQAYEKALADKPTLEQVDAAVYQFQTAVEESLRTP